MRHTTFLVFLTVLLGLTACQGETDRRPPAAQAEQAIPFRQDGTLDFVRDGARYLTIAVEIADSDSARVRGLMQRTSLPERSGMLFIFNQEEPQSFWMANTPLALDLFFVNADSQIVKITKYTRPLSPENITSDVPARFVIETPAGFADNHGIIESDHVRWRR